MIVDIILLAYFPFAMNLLYRILKNWREYEVKPDPRRTFHSPRLFFLIASKKCSRVVQMGIDSIHDACRKIGFGNYEVMVVADSAIHPPKDAKLILVPEDYACGAKHKARALQYALRFIPFSKSSWIFHMDEESVVTEQCLRAVLEYTEGERNPIAEGPINYPIDVRNMLTLFLEGERSVSCFYCVDQMKNGPVWMHGSNLLVRSDVEHEIGWEFDTICEDQRFAYEAERKLGSKVFGWHGGLVLEKPAFSILDAIRQRKRWFYGGLLNLKHIPRKGRVLQIFFLTTWFFGFIACIMGPLALAGFIKIGELFKIPLFFSLAVWLGQYQLGLYLNLRHVNIGRAKRAFYHLAQFVLCPAVGFISTLPTFLALIKPPKGFEVIRKT